MSFETWTLEEAEIRLIDGDRGKNYPKQADFSPSGHCLFLSAKNVTSSGFQFEDLVFIGKNRHDLLRAGTLKRGDIVMTTRGTIGNVAYYNSSVRYPIVRINSGMIIFRANQDLWNARLLYYVLTSPVIQDQIRNLTSGSAVPQLPARDLKKFELPKITLPVQNRIEAIISSISDKKIINHKINQTLEQMAQAIFKSWFVDFEPVKAKIAALEAGGSEEDALLAAMQAISGKTTDELARLQTDHPDHYNSLRATSEMFPSAMQASELGEIPEGWWHGQLGDIAFFPKERRSTHELTVENYVSTENMLEGKKGIGKASSLPSSATVPSFESGQVLVSNIRPYFKKIWMASISGGRSPDVLGFQSKEEGVDEYLLNLLYRDHFFDYMMLTSKGAKMPRGDKKAIMQYLVVIPPITLMRNFSGRVKAVYQLHVHNGGENTSLEELRDALLPKLLSGELTVSEEAIEENGLKEAARV